MLYYSLKCYHIIYEIYVTMLYIWPDNPCASRPLADLGPPRNVLRTIAWPLGGAPAHGPNRRTCLRGLHIGCQNMVDFWNVEKIGKYEKVALATATMV